MYACMYVCVYDFEEIIEDQLSKDFENLKELPMQGRLPDVSKKSTPF